jgi:hypothetical protein
MGGDPLAGGPPVTNGQWRRRTGPIIDPRDPLGTGDLPSSRPSASARTSPAPQRLGTPASPALPGGPPPVGGAAGLGAAAGAPQGQPAQAPGHGPGRRAHRHGQHEPAGRGARNAPGVAAAAGPPRGVAPSAMPPNGTMPPNGAVPPNLAVPPNGAMPPNGGGAYGVAPSAAPVYDVVPFDAAPVYDVVPFDAAPGGTARADPRGRLRDAEQGVSPPAPVEMTSVLSRAVGGGRAGRDVAADPIRPAGADQVAEPRPRRVDSPPTDLLDPVRPAEAAPVPPTQTGRRGRHAGRLDQAGPALADLLEPATPTDTDAPSPAAASGPGGTRRRFATEDLSDLRDEIGSARPSTGRAGAHEDPNDRLAWFRHGWLGPLAVAVTLALVALGLYVLVSGRGGGGRGGSEVAATTPAAPVGTNPDAKTGKALVDGTYTCQTGPTTAATATSGATTAPAGTGATTATTSVLIVPTTTGTYTWNGQSGSYAIATPNYDDPSNIIASVSFSSGPLQGDTATSIAGWPKGGGRVTATVMLTKGNSMFCKLN